MKGAIFGYNIDFWKKIDKQMQERAKEANFPDDTDFRVFELDFILQTIKSYKPSPNGNGIKWSKEEKEAFKKLTYKEQRKMIVRKSELKSVLFPYVDVDYEPYKYSDRISDTAQKAYQKAQNLLKSNERYDFNNIPRNIRQEILHNLRVAYKEQYYKAGVELAKLLFKQGSYGQREIGNIEESAQITRELWHKEKIPESAYMYYQLYKWVKYEVVPYSTKALLLNEEEAKECYNYALECVVWEAIDEEAQRKEVKDTFIAAELWLAAAIKYQSPLAAILASSSFTPSTPSIDAIDFHSYIMYNACLRCAIALGGYKDSVGSLAIIYANGRKGLPESHLKSSQLKSYSNQSPQAKGLINGLDPYFDEKFPPDSVIDFTSYIIRFVYDSLTYNDYEWIGIRKAIEKGYIKDPRDKNSTMESIKEYYLMVWRIIVQNSTYYTYSNPFQFYDSYITYLRYSNLAYGLPSARPYIFPKEVLDLEIDFNEGMEKDYERHKASNRKIGAE